MNETFTIVLTIEQVGMIQRALRHSIWSADVTNDPRVDVRRLDIEHLRTHIAQSTQEEQ